MVLGSVIFYVAVHFEEWAFEKQAVFLLDCFVWRNTKLVSQIKPIGPGRAQPRGLILRILFLRLVRSVSSGWASKLHPLTVMQVPPHSKFFHKFETVQNYTRPYHFSSSKCLLLIHEMIISQFCAVFCNQPTAGCTIICHHQLLKLTGHSHFLLNKSASNFDLPHMNLFA